MHLRVIHNIKTTVFVDAIRRLSDLSG